MSAQPIVGVYLDAADAGLLVRLIDDYSAHLRSGVDDRALGNRVLALRAELDRANARVSARPSNVSANVSVLGAQRDPSQSEVYALIDSGQAAAVLGCTPGNVRDLARRGRLAARRAGGRWVYSLLDVERVAAERARGVHR
ncbi:helix-turn-helix domain-containing protein [Rhodococcus hoagii]|nr:helix-turn-helix domain-containing protein [Prescottella equi]